MFENIKEIGFGDRTITFAICGDKLVPHSYYSEEEQRYKPAIVYDNGLEEWYYYGKVHSYVDSNNIRLPSKIIRNTRFKSFHDHGLLQSFTSVDENNQPCDNPAIVELNGNLIWCKNGMVHRDNDLPAIIQMNGDKIWCRQWYKDDLKHREDNKPAVITSYGKHKWFKNGVEYQPSICIKLKYFLCKNNC